MRFTVGTRYRVLIDHASLRTSHAKSYGGGAVALSFASERLFKGDVIAYIGTRNIGSDSYDEDVFQTADGVKGPYHPQSCGAAVWSSLAPIVPIRAIATNGQSFLGEFGTLLDAIALDELASLDHNDAIALFGLNDLARALAEEIPADIALSALACDPAEYGAYVAWREAVEAYEKRCVQRVVDLLHENGDIATLTKKSHGSWWSAGAHVLYREDIGIALRRGAIQHVGDTIIPVAVI